MKDKLATSSYPEDNPLIKKVVGNFLSTEPLFKIDTYLHPSYVYNSMYQPPSPFPLSPLITEL